MSLGRAIAISTQRLVAPVAGMHHAIADRSFVALGAIASPVRLMHNTISDLVYGAIRLAGTAIGVGIDHRLVVADSTTNRADAWVNGLWGDALEPHYGTMAISMSARGRDGEAVNAATDVANAFPGATGHLVVLVHGLAETEACFSGSPSTAGIFEAVSRHPQLTPIPIRYNTGLRVSSNGSYLAELIEVVSEAWPVPVRSIALVGHSMGGLVVRSACLAAGEERMSWLDAVTDVVTVGTPHRGAPLEKVANVTAWALNFAQETRPLAEFLNARSAGIKDLRFGSIAKSDWEAVDPDALLANTVGAHHLPPDAEHHFVGGTVTRDPSHPVGVAFGDLVVRPVSSSGGPQGAPTNKMVVGGTRHTDLLHDPTVVNRVMQWLSPEDEIRFRHVPAEPADQAETL